MIVQYHHQTKITRLRFDPFGHKFGATDVAGDLCLYQFGVGNGNQGMILPYMVLSCHSRQASDFTFLNSTSVVATAGSSPGHISNIAIWDTLLPTHKARIKGFHVHESGAQTLIYDVNSQRLISGGKKGDICVFDLRQRLCINTFAAHSQTVNTLAIDPVRQTLLSGSNDGNIKIWNLKTFEEISCIKHIHPSKRFLTPSLDKMPVSTYGVMQIVPGRNFHLSCGADGTVKAFRHV
ncbi:WD40-repeat-containing domain protein [Paraphysoderma sedebokerense]|nr:WD40-repeat-containing domain protein [Paraphysoderma sedebokerense]